MKKKLLTVLMAAVITVSSALCAFAKTTTTSLGSVEASGWWVEHSTAYLLKDGADVTFTMNSVTYDTASANWNGPIWVLYSADEAFAGGSGLSDTAGYAEYLVNRVDIYWWAADGTNRFANDALSTVTSYEVVEPDGIWDNFVADLKAGITWTVNVKVSGSTVTIVSTTSTGLQSTAVVNVDSSKDNYITFGGELCSITNIKASVTTADETTTAIEVVTNENGETETIIITEAVNPESGDASVVIPMALIAMVAVGAVLATKKKTVTE